MAAEQSLARQGRQHYPGFTEAHPSVEALHWGVDLCRQEGLWALFGRAVPSFRKRAQEGGGCKRCASSVLH